LTGNDLSVLIKKGREGDLRALLEVRVRVRVRVRSKREGRRKSGHY